MKLGACTCGTCAYEDVDCENTLKLLCKINGKPDNHYKTNMCENCGVLKKICGETCDYCESWIKWSSSKFFYNTNRQ